MMIYVRTSEKMPENCLAILAVEIKGRSRFFDASRWSAAGRTTRRP